MEILIGENAGFCYGVKRAVDGAKKETLNNKEIYCLGEIVHNKNVVDELKNEGIVFIENIEDSKGITIIRAHGVSHDVYEKAKMMGLALVDLTCPSVLKIHKIAKQYSQKGYYIIITGKSTHPEVIGIESCSGKKYSIIYSKEELEKIIDKIKNEEKVLLISQTTYSSKKFDEIAELLKEVLGEKLEINKTICPATEIRQKETEELAKQVDLMIVIGDKKSSNTNKLYDISCKYCKNVMFIQDEKDIDLVNLEDIQKVGIMAGASTPKEDIIKVKEVILKREDKI